MIIVTKKDTEIISWADEPWPYPGHYNDALFNVIICEGEGIPIHINSFGPATPRWFDVQFDESCTEEIDALGMKILHVQPIEGSNMLRGKAFCKTVFLMADVEFAIDGD